MENFNEYMRDLFHQQQELIIELDIINCKIKDAIAEHNKQAQKTREFSALVDEIYEELK